MVDLLEYRDEDFLLTVKGGVPAGRYEKIRLEVADIQSEGGQCDDNWIKLPSGKIDLNPRGGFEVLPDETLAIRLDIDANKSINLHPAGNSMKCIFRPVVFVDITPVMPRPVCPLIVTGRIEELLDRDTNGVTDGFILDLAPHSDLSDSRGSLEVRLGDGVRIFDREGLPANPDVLLKDQPAWVRGRLKTGGFLEASVVVVGQVLTVDGKVEGPVNSSSVFPFLPNPLQELVGQVNVQLFENESLVLLGCDTEVGLDAIKMDEAARVVGKFSVPDVELRAAVVSLREGEISGEITMVVSTVEGAFLTIDPSSSIQGDERTVFVPKGTPVLLEGDGDVPFELLCVGRKVRVTLDPKMPDPTATKVRVEADLLEGTVTAKPGGTFLTLNVGGQSQTVHVRADATILDQRGVGDSLADFDDIQIGQQIRIFGLQPLLTCNLNFEGFVVLIVGPTP
jgi:hypothetical protein